MYFARLIPDWNSLDSVRRAHGELEAAALVLFALLVFFDVLAHLAKDDKKKTLLENVALCLFGVAVLTEIVAYPYGQRNDVLSARVIGSLSDNANQANRKAREAIHNSSIALSQAKDALSKAGAAQASVAKARLGAAEATQLAESERQARIAIEEKLAGWKLTRKQQDTLVARLSPFANTPFDLSVNPNESAFMEIMDSVLTRARWTRHDPKALPNVRAPDTLGVIMLIHNKAAINTVRGEVLIELPEPLLKDFEKACVELEKGLQEDGISAKAGRTLQDPNPTSIHIVIGSRE